MLKNDELKIKTELLVNQFLDVLNKFQQIQIENRDLNVMFHNQRRIIDSIKSIVSNVQVQDNEVIEHFYTSKNFKPIICQTSQNVC